MLFRHRICEDAFCAGRPQKNNTGDRRGWDHTRVIFALIYGNQLELMGLPFVPEHDIAGPWTKLLHKEYLAYKFSICKFLLINYYYYNHYTIFLLINYYYNHYNILRFYT